MLKKSIYGLLLLAIAMPAFAGDTETKYEVGVWPMAYKFMPMCDRIEVYMNVGYYVKIKDCTKPYKLYLKQDSMDDYSGCVDFEIKANFNLELGASVKVLPAAAQFTDKDTKWRAWIKGDNFLAPTKDYKTRTLCVEVTDAEIGLATGPNKKLKVATASILVRPTAQPNWWM